MGVTIILLLGVYNVRFLLLWLSKLIHSFEGKKMLVIAKLLSVLSLFQCCGLYIYIMQYIHRGVHSKYYNIYRVERGIF